MSRTRSRLGGLLALLLVPSACASGGSPIRDVTAVEVTLVPREGEPRPARAVEAARIPQWSACLAKLEPIAVEEAYKLVLEEGEYRLDVVAASGAHRMTLHNAHDLSDAGGKLYRSDCVYDLAR